jgi:hypothetical protein
MDKGKYILLLLFISFNVLVGLSLLVKAMAQAVRVWWKDAKVSRPAAMAGNSSLPNTAWRNQRPRRAIHGAL